MTNVLLKAVLAIAIAVSPFAALADETTHDAQVALRALGYLKGKPDGDFGPKTAAALGAFCTDHNLPSDGNLDAHDLIELQYAAKDIVKIPLLINYDVGPDGRGLVLTDVAKNDYAQCEVSSYFILMRRPMAFTEIVDGFQGFFEPDLYPNYMASKVEQETDDITGIFNAEVFNLHHRCLEGQRDTCQTIIDIAKLMTSKGSYVLTVDPNKQVAVSEVYFRSKQKVLMPLLIAYSTAIQVLGKPPEHEAIGKWAYSAILQNTFDPFDLDPYAKPNFRSATRELFRRGEPDADLVGSGCRDLRGGSHSLKSGYLAGMYGAIWNDEHMFRIAFDVAEFVLNDIDENGATCNASRGASALGYLGGDLNTILLIFQLAKMNGIDPMTIKNAGNVHRMAEFILNSALDDTVLETYAKQNFLPGCGEDYHRQCIDKSAFRMAAFGWIPLYRNLFPDGPASKHFDELVHEMETSTTLTEDRKWALTAILRSNYPYATIKHNFANVSVENWDNAFVIYTDVINSNMGSPYCLYGYTERKQ